MQLVIKPCLSRGLITEWFLFNDRSLRIAPPLIITEEQVDELCGKLAAGLDQTLAHVKKEGLLAF